MEKKIYRKLVPTLVILISIIACGRKGPLIPRDKLVPPVPIIKKIIMTDKNGTIFLKLPSLKIQQYKIKPVAIEIAFPGRHKIYNVYTLKKQLGFYVVKITRGVQFFRLRSLSRYGKGKFTNWFYTPPHPNIKSPKIINLTLVENGVKFYWKIRGKSEGILVYMGNSPFSLKLISLKPRTTSPVYIISLPLHKRYYLAIRNFITCEKKFLCVSPPSRIYEFYTKDIIPPPPPMSLTAMKRFGKIYLYWESITAKDLLYYRIYRKKDIAAKWKFIGNTVRNHFIDRGCGKDEKCYYTITAVDKDGNESTNSNIVVVGGEQ